MKSIVLSKDVVTVVNNCVISLHFIKSEETNWFWTCIMDDGLMDDIQQASGDPIYANN